VSDLQAIGPDQSNVCSRPSWCSAASLCSFAEAPMGRFRNAVVAHNCVGYGTLPKSSFSAIRIEAEPANLCVRKLFGVSTLKGKGAPLPPPT
jgi:hypothetical protein